MMTSLEGDTFEYVVRFRFNVSTNEAGYEAAIARINLYINENKNENTLSSHIKPDRKHLQS